MVCLLSSKTLSLTVVTLVVACIGILRRSTHILQAVILLCLIDEVADVVR